VVAVTLPIAFGTDLTATTAGRRALFFITFLPLLVCVAVAPRLAWRMAGGRQAEGRLNRRA
jgi:hypothetical protein